MYLSLADAKASKTIHAQSVIADKKNSNTIKAKALINELQKGNFTDEHAKTKLQKLRALKRQLDDVYKVVVNSNYFQENPDNWKQFRLYFVLLFRTPLQTNNLPIFDKYIKHFNF